MGHAAFYYASSFRNQFTEHYYHEMSAWPPVVVIDEQIFLSSTSLFAVACQVKWCVLVSESSFISVYGVEPLLNDISMQTFATGTQSKQAAIITKPAFQR